MKRLFIILAAAVMAVSMMAENHLKCKGVEIDGSPQVFAEKLAAKGFEYLGDKDGTPILKGTFAGYSDCIIMIVAKDGRTTYRVGVTFPECDTWELLYNNYVTIKEMLATKYGKPVSDVEEWQGLGSEPRDDNRKMHELRMNRLKMSASFVVPNGAITVEMLNSLMHCQVMLIYSDAINNTAAIQHAIDDL